MSDTQRQLENQGYRVIRLNDKKENSPELYAPIVKHNLRTTGQARELRRFEKALELRKKGHSGSDIRRRLRQ